MVSLFHKQPAKPQTSWEVTVTNGYSPKTITVPKGKTSKITFTRRTPMMCVEEIVIDEFGIKQFLPLNRPVTITLSPSREGRFSMHCGMNMVKGTVTVV